MNAAIRAEGLVKHYGDVKALDGLDLEVPEGTVLGVLGPNGAGKTTAVRVLTTLLRPDAGTATVAGVDVVADPARVRPLIGLSGQYAAVDEHLTGRENLQMFAQLHRMSAKAARVRAEELLGRFSLTDAGDRPVKTYSGGMRRRLDLAGALVASPQVIFLDEPTTGLDPRSRQDMWEVIGELVRGGVSLLLTTQYLEEADRLADTIVVVDHGKVIAKGSADELKSEIGGETLDVVVATDDQVAPAVEALRGIGHGAPTVDDKTRRISVAVSGGAASLVEAVRRFDERGVKILDIGLHRPTLDDVFLALTGRSAEEAEAAAQERAAATRKEGRS